MQDRTNMDDVSKMSTSELFVAPVATTTFSISDQVDHLTKIYMKAYSKGTMSEKRALDSLGSSLRVMKSVCKDISIPKGYVAKIEVMNIEESYGPNGALTRVVPAMLGVLFCRVEAGQDIDLFSIDITINPGKLQEFPHQINPNEIGSSVIASEINTVEDIQLLTTVGKVINAYAKTVKGFCLFVKNDILAIISASPKTVMCINLIHDTVGFQEQH
jgi:hypothetical protein